MIKTLELNFCSRANSEEAIKRTIYRLVDIASCHLSLSEDRWVVAISPKHEIELETIRERFEVALADENLRVLLAPKVDPIKNVIVALAFGSLVESDG